MDPKQIFFGASLVVVLVAMACYFAWRQIQALRTLRRPNELSPADRSYVLYQAWRRLACSVLMLVLAVLLATSFFLEGPAETLAAQGEAARERGVAPKLDPSQVQFLDLYRNYWIIVLLVLLAIIVLAAWDYLAIWRFGQQQYRQLQRDRRTMIENELARLRSQRNGHN